MKEDINSLVISCLNELLSEMDEQDQSQIPALDESTYLFGRKGILDSLGLVTLIVNIEQKLNEDYGTTITIADERAMSQERSPFRTVGSLIQYISLLIEEEKKRV